MNTYIHVHQLYTHPNQPITNKSHAYFVIMRYTCKAPVLEITGERLNESALNMFHSLLTPFL